MSNTKRLRLNPNDDVFQWSNNNSNNDNLDNENGRRNRLKTTGFKGDGRDYSNSEKIHAADFNYIFNHISTNLRNISLNLTELYDHVESNKNEIDTNLATFERFRNVEYVNERNSYNTRFGELESFKNTASSDSWVVNKVNGNRLELGNVKIKNKNGANNANLSFQDDNSKIYTLFSEGNTFGLYDETNSRNILKIENDGRVRFYRDVLLGEGSNPLYIANVKTPNSERDAANKKYVDDTIRSVAKTDTSNTFTQENTFNSINVKDYVYLKSNNSNSSKQDVYGIFNYDQENYFAIKNITKRKDLILFNNQNQLNGGSLKEYIDNKFNNSLQKNTVNYLTYDLIMNNSKKIQLAGNSSSNSQYYIYNDNGIFKLTSSSSTKPLISFEGNSWRDSSLLDIVRELNRKKRVFSDLIITSLVDTYTNEGEYFSNQHTHIDSSWNSIKMGYQKSSNLAPYHSFILKSSSNGQWNIESKATNGLSSSSTSSQIDIAFDSSGLTTSRLKTYIDNKVSSRSTPTQKDYKVYQATKEVVINDSSSIYDNNKGVNVYGFSPTVDSSDNIFGLTLYVEFKSNTNGLKWRSVSLSPLDMGYTSQVISVTDSGKSHHFQIQKYSSSWNDLYVRYIGANTLFNNEWQKNKDIMKIKVGLAFQKA